MIPVYLSRLLGNPLRPESKIVEGFANKYFVYCEHTTPTFPGEPHEWLLTDSSFEYWIISPIAYTYVTPTSADHFSIDRAIPELSRWLKHPKALDIARKNAQKNANRST